jgi:hypothetical protein
MPNRYNEPDAKDRRRLFVSYTPREKEVRRVKPLIDEFLRQLPHHTWSQCGIWYDGVDLRRQARTDGRGNPSGAYRCTRAVRLYCCAPSSLHGPRPGACEKAGGVQAVKKKVREAAAEARSRVPSARAGAHDRLDDDQLLRNPEVGQWIGVSTMQVYRLIPSPRPIPVRRVGHVLRVRVGDLRECTAGANRRRVRCSKI